MNLRIDGEKLRFHPARVAKWQSAKTWDEARDIYPIYVEISPVGACNHRCTFCAVDYIGYKSNRLDGVVLRETLRDMARAGVKSVMFGGEGEPLLHKEINSAVVTASACGLDVAFTTNGVLLDRLETLSLCQWVKVSINGGTAKTYAAVHRTKEKDFEAVWTNIYEAAKRKGPCMLGVQTLFLPEVASEIQTLYDRCNDLGVDYFVVKPYSQHKRSINKHDGMSLRPPEIIERECKFIFRSNVHETRSIARCHATPHFWAYIMATGDIYSCSAFLLDDRFKLGNINESSFKQIWRSREENWHLVRETLDISECRVNCRMARVNEYLEELKVGPFGVNFI